MHMAISYKGNTLPEGIQVMYINDSVMPPVELETQDIAVREGEYVDYRKFGAREIIINFIITTDTEAEMHDKIKEFADFLYSEEPEQLIVLSDSDYYYNAIVSDTTEIEVESPQVTTIEVTFYCADPFKYNADILQDYEILPTNGNSTIINNNGSVYAYPTFVLDFSGDSTFYAISNETTRQVFLIGADVVLEDGERYYLVDYIDREAHKMNNLSNWTQYSAGYTDSIVSDLELTPITSTFSLQSKTLNGDEGIGFGVPQGSWGANVADPNVWNYAVASRELSSQPNNWSISFDIQYKGHTNAGYQGARGVVHLLDSNSRRLARIIFQNHNNYRHYSPRVWFSLWEDDGTTAGTVFYTANTSNETWADARANRPYGYYYNTEGIIRMRIAKRQQDVRLWVGYLENRDEGLTCIRQDTFTTKTDKLDSRPFRYVYTATAKTYTQPEPEYMIIHSTEVVEELSTQDGVPYIISSDNRAIVSSQDATSYKDGVPFYEFIDPTSNFPFLQKGSNTISVIAQDSSLSSAIMYKHERFL